MAEHLSDQGKSPICPRCGWEGFDDWWHVLDPITVKGKLTCECGVFFIHGRPGTLVESSCFGVRKPNHPLYIKESS